MNFETFYKSYWKYYLELEQSFLETERYVSFDKRNYKAFSVEYVKLLQVICSEIDVVAKEIAKYNDSNFNVRKSNISKWCYELMILFPNVSNQIVMFNDNKLQPWKSIKYVKYKDAKGNTRFKLDDKHKSPEWWKAYNKVKHQRTTIVKNEPNYVNANLKNVTDALAALYIIEVMMLNELGKNNKQSYSSKAFRMLFDNEEG